MLLFNIPHLLSFSVYMQDFSGSSIIYHPYNLPSPVLFQRSDYGIWNTNFLLTLLFGIRSHTLTSNIDLSMICWFNCIWFILFLVEVHHWKNALLQPLWQDARTPEPWFWNPSAPHKRPKHQLLDDRWPLKFYYSWINAENLKMLKTRTKNC